MPRLTPRRSTLTATLGGLALALPATLATSASADVVGRAISASGDLNVTSYTNPFDPAGGGTDFTDTRDGFMIYSLVLESDEGQDVPFDLIDDSVDDFVTDTQGIVVDGAGGDPNPFFGATDVINNDNSGLVTALWGFDVSSAGGLPLQLSFDLAAMGDFEANDFVEFAVSTDGGSTYTPVLVPAADEAAEVTYTMASGTEVTLADPLVANGVTLTNNFQTFSFDGIDSSNGSVLFRFSTDTNGNGEAIVFRDVVLESVIPEPTGLALLGLGGLALVRRRRA